MERFQLFGGSVAKRLNLGAEKGYEALAPTAKTSSLAPFETLKISRMPSVVEALVEASIASNPGLLATVPLLLAMQIPKSGGRR
jgi:hypothetical protein